jgi:hypothetical protein
VGPHPQIFFDCRHITPLQLGEFFDPSAALFRNIIPCCLFQVRSI